MRKVRKRLWSHWRTLKTNVKWWECNNDEHAEEQWQVWRYWNEEKAGNKDNAKHAEYAEKKMT